ncbi:MULTISPECIES: GNAT family N-acetyltransferase [unclassified Rhizobium]|uniref:GNAT family N-acetyltransferase n=1 Tax=unclassified Rhizobium TaxID=2613769 RepID=UPI0007151BEA|nr:MULTISPECIES: GNAT family N-acetyltransferase [unclassified Rhizobium]KQS87975.1 acetyltransferase [Rhizobium sp. Leaf386]KQS94469.1 acetyltransferase [Rhizobium sp. Leaf391]KQU01474.1 acetyltransferase [Rhizobium sp. Leaf453]
MQLLAIDEAFADWDALLALILESFAYMHSRIEPPSSALRLTLDSLKEKARVEKAFAAVEDARLLGCIFCKPEPPDCLYIGKLAIAPEAQRKGVGRLLLEVATDYAVAQGLSCLRLETRIELTENHGVFARWGFVRSADGVHPGFSRTTFIEMRKPI